MATWLLLLSPPRSVVPARPLLEGPAESSLHVDGPLSGSRRPRAQQCGRGDGESPGPASAQHPEPGGGAQPRPGLPGRHSWALPMCPGPSGGLLSVTLPGGHHVPGPDRSGPAGQLLHHQPQEAEEGMGVDVRGMRKSRVAWPAARSAPARTMSDYENEDECWSGLEGFRVKLISVIDPARITPYLRQCKVLSPDDEEQVLSDPSLVIRKRKVGVLLDILQRTGHKGYVAFLESLELYYPQLYKKVTGKEPTRVFSVIIDASGESGLTQLLMSEVMKLQKKAQDLTALLGSKDDLIKELRVKDSLLRKHQERAQRLKEACEAGGRELQRCKDENYDLALRLARQSEERGAALMRNRDLQLEIDRLKHSLMKAEDDCSVERKHTLKLRHAMEQRPSQELLWELQQEKALLQARVQGLEASVQEGRPDQSSPYIQVLEEDWRQAQRDLQEQTRTVFSLRKDLRQAEAQRARCLEEKEVFELQCLALRKDSKMSKDRVEAILRQMEEVAVERDQLKKPWRLCGLPACVREHARRRVASAPCPIALLSNRSRPMLQSLSGG
ncbi:caspase recruitment domain-containing protein 9 isoform X2 [Phacochoerus africanus]|uniref:caspase recruitment domain-containing protein 9 isoform X2 n=1 Tax=Phacochoerus africanus TaxID=41426 RepID=UPI001FD928CA|nr:caspase recruitment domain-containing protein 9 isoform X2 [Phacochoerus africanus]